MWRTNAIPVVMLAGVLGLSSPPAWALLLALTPASQTVEVGDSVTVDLDISGLGDCAAPSLGTWDVDIGFDTSVLAFIDAGFGDPSLGDQLDLFGLGAFTASSETGGVIDLSELSFDSAVDLNGLQPGTFTLATLHFNVDAAGTSPLSLTIDALGDANGDPLISGAQGASITAVARTAVPAPPAWALLMSALLYAIIGPPRRTRALDGHRGEKRHSGKRLRLTVTLLAAPSTARPRSKSLARPLKTLTTPRPGPSTHSTSWLSTAHTAGPPNTGGCSFG